MVPLVKTVGSQCVCSWFYQWYTNVVQGYTNGTIGNTIGTNGNANGTICSPNGTVGTIGKLIVCAFRIFPMVPLKILPMNPERFSAANGTIGANVTVGGNVGTNGTIGSPNGTIGSSNGTNGTIGKPNGVNSYRVQAGPEF